MTRDKFLETLFDPGQKTCFTKTSKGTRLRQPLQTDLFFSINALHPKKDMNPTQPYHNWYTPRRADGNVICFRNFLIELDDYTTEQQIKYVSDKIPFTSAVFSGGKSVHFIVSLKTPLADAEEYSKVAYRLHTLLPLSDKTTKNPSRLSRLPGVRRPDTGAMQNLLQLNGRIANHELLDILPEIPEFKKAERNSDFLSVDILNAISRPDSTRADLGLGRNSFFFWLSCRLDEAGIYAGDRREKVERAYYNLRDKTDFKLSEALMAARSK